MIAYHDILFKESLDESLYVIQKMHKDLVQFATEKWNGKFDDDANLVEDSVTKGQFRNYQIRTQQMQTLLNLAVNAENLLNSVSEEVQRLIEEKRAVAHQLTNLQEEFKNYKLAQCSPQCPRICNTIRSLEKTQRNQMIRETHDLQLRNEMPQLF